MVTTKKSMKGIRSTVTRYETGYECNHDLMLVVDVLSENTGQKVDDHILYGVSALFHGAVCYRFRYGLGNWDLFYDRIRTIEAVTGKKLCPSYGGWSELASSDAGLVIETTQLFADNGCGADCSKGDKPRDAKMGLYHLSAESEYVGRVKVRITEDHGDDGVIYLKPHVVDRFGTATVKIAAWETLDPEAVMDGTSVMLKGMTLRESRIITEDPEVDGWCPKATSKYFHGNVGDVVEVELFMAKRESDDHLLLDAMKRDGLELIPPRRMVDFQCLFRTFDLFTVQAQGMIEDQIRSNLARYYDIFSSREKLVEYLKEKGSDLETSQTLSTTVKALLMGLPVQAKEIESLLRPIAEQVFPVLFPCWDFRALPNAELAIDEIELPIQMAGKYPTGAAFTVFRAPNTGVELLNTHVVGFSDTCRVSPLLLAILLGDFDGDRLRLVEGHLLANNEQVLARFQAFRNAVSAAKPTGQKRALTCAEANFRAVEASVKIGILDSEISGVFADIPGYGKQHALAGSVLLACVDSIKHSEIEVPNPGDISIVTGCKGKTRRKAPALYRLLNRRFETFAEVNDLVSAAANVGLRPGMARLEAAAVPALRLMAMPDSNRNKGATAQSGLCVDEDTLEILRYIEPSLATVRGNFEFTVVDPAIRKELLPSARNYVASMGKDEANLASCAQAAKIAARTVDLYRRYLDLVRKGNKSDIQATADRHEAYLIMEEQREFLKALAATDEMGARTAGRVHALLFLHVTSGYPLPGVAKPLTSFRVFAHLLPSVGKFNITRMMETISNRWRPVYAMHQREPRIVKLG